MLDEVPRVSGLDGVVVADTRLSRVEGERGRLTIAGYAVEALAPTLSFEAVVYLLWHDRLPSAAQLRALRAQLGAARQLSPASLALLRAAAARSLEPMEALRMGVASLSLDAHTDIELLAGLPVLVAAYERLRRGLEPVAPDPSLGSCADFLHMLDGEAPSVARVRGLETYLNTIVDHGFNASTFTARVIASTGAGLGPALEGAIGALAGPLHGGAPGPALAALERLREQGGDLDPRTRSWVETELDAGARIMGFGHRVYRTRDPRADVLGAAAATALLGTGLYEDARVHERAVLETLAARKPGRTIATNVEFYTALLLHGLGIANEAFTCVFAMGRAAGWIAHYEEQRAQGRLIRPRARYCGAQGRVLPS